MGNPKHYSISPYVNRNMFRVGMLPSANALDYMRITWQHMRMYSRAHQIAAYTGFPHSYVNGDLACTFYPITTAPVVSYGPYYIGGAMSFWEYDCSDTPATATVSWHDTTGGAAVKTFSWTVNYSGTQTPYEVPSGGLVELDYIPFTPTSSNDGFSVHKLLATNLLPASLGLWTTPGKTINDAINLGLTDGTFSPEETIRGFDTTYGSSIGAIMHSMHHETTSELSVWHHTARCLFQTPYPTGVYWENTDEFPMASYLNMRGTADGTTLGQSYKVVPRNLRRLTGNIRTRPALVVSCSGTGVSLKLEASVSGDTWVWDSTGAESVTLLTPSDGTSSDTGALAVDPDGDYITLSCQLDIDEWVLVHTVSLWEWPNYDEESTV